MSTITTIQGSDVISTSRTDINTNFANLNSDKIETSYLDTDTSLSANSDTKIPTQKAVKAYADSVSSPTGKSWNEYAVDSVGTDSYAITLTGFTAYVAGQTFKFKAGTANTGACSLNVNGLGAKTIKKDVSSDLVTGDILLNQVVTVIYDGTNMQMVGKFPAPTPVTNKEMFCYPLSEGGSTFPYSVELGGFITGSIDSSQYEYFTFSIPSNFSSIVGLKLVCIPDATETIQWDTLVGIAANSESYNASEASDLDRTLAVTGSKITELDLLQGNLVAHLATVAANDYMGIKFTSNTTLLRPIGIKLTYTPATL